MTYQWGGGTVPYFDVTVDNVLLPPAVRNHTELARAAVVAEFGVIGYYVDDPPYFLYTNQLGLQGFFDASWGVGEDITNQSAPASAVVAQTRVYLRGWKVNANDPAVDPNLKLALKFTIADCVRWKIQQWVERDPGVQSRSNEGRSITFRDAIEAEFPPEWNWRLTPFASHKLTWGW